MFAVITAQELTSQDSSCVKNLLLIVNRSQAKQGSVTFEFSACSTGKVEAPGRGPFFFPTYLGTSKDLYSQGIVNYTCNLEIFKCFSLKLSKFSQSQKTKSYIPRINRHDQFAFLFYPFRTLTLFSLFFIIL